MNRRIITPLLDEWSEGLTELTSHAPPKRLYVEGLPLAHKEQSVAVVGTRRATSAGIEVATELARGLAQAGFTVVSGLAMGVDTAAHRAALAAGGHTVAVLGTGLDVRFPDRNKGLQAEISGKGTVVTEYPDGTPPYKGNFPARNRIIAGLSTGVVVVEGGHKSGALITARIALDEGREVWAVPGSIRNAMAVGPNDLIRTGNAHLVTKVSHIFEEVSPAMVWEERNKREIKGPALNEAERSVLFVLDDVGLSPDRICRRTGRTLGDVALSLAKLEVQGLAVQRSSGYEVTGMGARVRAELA